MDPGSSRGRRNALLLRDNDLLRFVPDGENGETSALFIRAWDQTSGTEGGRADLTTLGTGGSSAFSADAEQVVITVTDVNDAPDLNPVGQNTLTSISENDFASAGNTISQILASSTSGSFSDLDLSLIHISEPTRPY